VHKIIQIAQKEKRSLLEPEAIEFLKEYGFFIPDYELIRTEDEIEKIKQKINYPIVMKIVSPDIIHKSDAKGVRLNIKNEEEARIAFREIIQNIKKYKKEASILGVIVCQLFPTGTEIIIGMTKDPHFGPVIMFGLGGIFVEALKDASFRILPLEEKDAIEMIKEIKGYNILKGARGESPRDIDAIKEALMKVSCLVMENPEIREVDLNPVFVYKKGLQIVDARIIL